MSIRVTLLSRDEGAQVFLGADQRAGTIENGRLVIEVPAGGPLAIETRKPGYHPSLEQFELGDQPLEISLRPLYRRSRFALELFSTSSQFLGLGAGFRFYLLPDTVIFRTDEYVYFSIGSQDGRSFTAFHSDFRIQFGSYLFSPPTRRLRLGVATGAGIILSVHGESEAGTEGSTYCDLYWDAIDIWLDYNWQKWALFFSVETKLALGLGDCLLERGLLTGYGPQFSLGWLRKL